MDKKHIVLLTVILLIPFSLQVTECIAAESPVFFPGIRPLGMGNAFLALSHDQNAFFYNPAGIAQREKAEISFFDLPVRLNEDTYNLIMYFWENRSSFTGGLTEDFLMGVADAWLNKTLRVYTGPPLNVNFISSPMGYLNFGLGVFAGALTVEQSVYGIGMPVFDLAAKVDSAVVLTGAYELIQNLSLGVNVKTVFRGKFEERNKSLTELIGYQIPDVDLGYGLGVDAGVLCFLSEQLNIAATVQDIGGTNLVYQKSLDLLDLFSRKITTEDIPEYTNKIPQRVNVGYAYIFTADQIPLGNNSTLAIDYTDVLSAIETNPYKKLHVGFEVAWKLFSLRVGLNQGYITAGANVSMTPVHLACAVYGEELGMNPGDNPQWNYVVSAAVRF